MSHYFNRMNGELYLERFSSFEQYADFLRKYAPEYRNKCEDSGESWFMTRNMDAYADMVRKGWPQGNKQISDMAAQIMADETFASVVQDWEFDVTGHSLDIGRYCDGEPEHWATPIETLGEGAGSRIVNLVANLSGSGATASRAMLNRNAMFAALVVALENQGFRVQFDCAYSSAGIGDQRYNWNMIMRVKDAEQSLDMDKLAVVAHPSTFRRGGLLSMEHATKGTVNSGYGHCCELHDSVKAEYGPGTIFVDVSEGWFDTDSQRIKWIQQVLAKIKRDISTASVTSTIEQRNEESSFNYR